MDLQGIRADQLTADDLLRELDSLCQARVETLRHGSDQALETHTRRMTELETEYRRRFPHREIEAARTRDGARAGL
jgi:hypothetical protein